MSLEELAKMKAADESFKKNQELKVENQRKALAEVTKDNIEMVIYYDLQIIYHRLILDKQISCRRKAPKRSRS